MLTIRITHLRDGGAVVSEETLQGSSYRVDVGPDACVVTIYQPSAQPGASPPPPTTVVLHKGDRGYVMNEQGRTVAHLPPWKPQPRAAEMRTG